MSLCPTVDVQSSDIISEVLNEVEKRSFTAQDPDDGKDFKLEKVPVNFRWLYSARINACSLLLSVPSDTSGDKEGQIPLLGIVLCIGALASVWK